MHITPHTAPEPHEARALIAVSVPDTLTTLGGRSHEVIGAPDCNSLVERVAELARTRLAPRAARYDADAAFPIDNYRDLHEAGVLGLNVPKAYGGVGADPLTYVLCLLEIANLYAVISLVEGTSSARDGLLCALIGRDAPGRYERKPPGRRHPHVLRTRARAAGGQPGSWRR